MGAILLTALVTVFGIWLIRHAWENDYLGTLIFLTVTGIAVVSCNQSEWYQSGERERDAARAAQERAEATPHVIREADGCKVYAFKAGNWHYFTRCGDGTVTTEGHRSETTGSGKNARTIDVAETIVTK